MDNLKLIAIVGMPGAGKSVAADFFHQKGIIILRFGDQTDIGLAEHNLPRNEKNERWYREKLRAELGMAAMAIKIEPRIKQAATTTNIVVLDGLYSWEELIYLKKVFPQIQILCVYASPKIRYDRLSEREIRPLNFSEAQSRDYAEIENLNKGGPIAIADHLIKNESTKVEFEDNLNKFYQTII